VALKQAGGLSEISRWLSEALRATPPEPNIKTTASRRDARDVRHNFLASLRDAFIFYSITGMSLAKPRSTTGLSLSNFRLEEPLETTRKNILTK
jgi:hypothetical protein